MSSFDAAVIGAGPNGLAAAITLARAGLKVRLREAAPIIGGAARSGELTLPGFVHDYGSTVQALARVSPFFKSMPLAELGVEFCEPPAAFGNTVGTTGAALCEGTVEQTAAGLGVDGDAYRRVFGPVVKNWDKIVPTLLAPPGTIPRHPFALASFGLQAIRSSKQFANHFKTPAARALWAGVAAHAILPFDFFTSGAFGLVLNASAHAVGWPVVKGGSQNLANAMGRYFESLGGVIELGAPVTTLAEFDGEKAVLCNIGPKQLLKIAGDRLPASYQKTLRKFRYGPGVFKMDWALSQPVPWTNPALARAGTVHVGDDYDAIAASERDSWEGRRPKSPFLLLVQPTVMDPSRAPAGKHILWGYMHVPHASTADETETIESQIERFAPGFRDCVIGRSVMKPADLEAFDANVVGGDVTGGANVLSQLFTRPAARLNPYSTPVKGLYLCSASTPPGGGVHGMGGMNAARSALKSVFGIKAK